MVYSKLNKSEEEFDISEDNFNMGIPKPRSSTFSKKTSTRPKMRPIGGLICNYGIIFTDCSMPFMDGYECCQRIHCLLDSLNIRAKPKILAVTGHVESEYQRKALRSGMDSLFSKPIKIDQLAMVLLEQGFYLKLPQELETELEEFSR